MAYKIDISETQRQALIEVLKNAQIDKTQFIDPITGENALEYWVGMLEDLPSIESEFPGVLHGFCI